MRSLKTLQKKLLLKRYGYMAYGFLKLVAPFSVSVSDLERWHPTLKNIHQFIDLYGRAMVLLGIGLAGFSIVAYHVWIMLWSYLS